jgi:dihydroorotate dehydrogenase
VRSALEKAIQKALLLVEPERAHNLALKLLPISRSMWRSGPADADERLKQRVFGLNFPNPVGVAAGVDKDAQVFYELLRFGFGFVEVGTVTPQPQPGNQEPRVFRLGKDEAIINRFGFNSLGKTEVLRRLAAHTGGGIVGVNIGANKNSADRVADYVQLIESFAPVASYFTVNVSSPNTPGLRNLQAAPALDDLLARVVATRDEVSLRAASTPVLLKISPDLSLSELDELVSVARHRKIDGMIVSNTTTARPHTLRETKLALETGGLSGKPLFGLATRMLAETFVRVEGQFPLIGVGGIDSGVTALAKMRAGANLVQLYSALVFRGLGLVGEIKDELIAALERGEARTLADLVGLDAADITAQPWPAV